MTETKHSPEPWKTAQAPNITDSLGQLVAQGFWDADRRRIVACVNACAGISTETLGTLPGYSAAIDGFHEQRDLVIKARNQRDELLAALKSVVDATAEFLLACKYELDHSYETKEEVMANMDNHWHECNIFKNAVADIAKAEAL